MSVTVSAATVFTAGVTISVFVVVVVAFCFGIVLESIVKVSLHCLVCITLNTAEQLNSRVAKCNLSTSANTTADKHINIECREHTCKCSMSAAVCIYYF